MNNNGSFVANSTSTISCMAQGGTNAFNNVGSFTQQGTGTTIFIVNGSGITLPFNNSAAVNIDAGSLYLASGGSQTGSFTLGSLGTLELNGTYTFSAAATLSGGGTVLVPAGTSTFNDSFTAGSLSITGGTVNFNGVTRFASVSFSSGTLGGSGTLTATGSMNWTGGTMQDTGTTVIATSATLNLSAGNLNRILENDGGAVWTGNGVQLTGGVFDNNGSFTANSTAGVYGGLNGTFNNDGSFIQQALGTYLGIEFNNNGTVDVTEGTLQIFDGTSSGRWNVTSATTVTFSSGYTFATGTTVSGTGNINFTGGTEIISGAVSMPCTLNFTSGVLAGSGNLSVTGAMNWSGGTMQGTGVTIIASGGALNLTPGTDNLNRVLENDGTAVWSGNGSIQFSGGTINNNGSFTADGTAGLVCYGGLNGTFNNTGTFTQQGAAMTSFQIAFSNSSTVNANAGSLYLGFGGTGSGSWNVASAASLTFSNGYTFATGTTASGTGKINFTGGTDTLSGAVSVPCTLNFTAGTLTGSGNLTITGTMNWGSNANGGSPVMAGTGTTIIAETGALNLTPGPYSGNSSGLNRVIENDGTAVWTGNGSIQFSGGTFNNNGSFTANSTSTLSCTTGGGSNAFNNAGTFIQQGTGATSLGIAFNNTGTVNASAGTLNLNAGGTDSGNWNTASAGTIILSNGYTFAAGTSVSGTGNINLIGGTQTFSGAVSVPCTLNFTAGTLTGSGNLTITGTMNWGSLNNSGAPTMAGNGSTIIATTGTLNLTPGQYISSEDNLDRMLENDGTTVWTGNGGSIQFSGGTFNNNGSFTANPASTLSCSGGGTPNGFNNAGTFNEQGTGTTTLSIPFNNTGTVNVNTGTLWLDWGGSQTGSFVLASNGTLQLSGAHSFASTANISGTGVVNITGGTSTIGAAWSGTLGLAVTQATVSIVSSATLASLSLSGGTVSIGPAAVGQAQSAMQPADSSLVTVVVNVKIQGIFSGGTFDVLAGAQLNSGGQVTFLRSNTVVSLASDAAAPGSLVLGGDVTLTGGTAQLESAGTAAKPGMVDLGGGQRSFTLNGSASSAELGISAQVTNGSLRNAGPGRLQLSNPSNAISAITLAGGMLEADTPGAVGSGPLTFKGGGVTFGNQSLTINNALTAAATDSITIDVGSGSVSIPTLTLGSALNVNGTGTLLITGPVVLQADCTINNTASVVFAAPVSGGFGFTKTLAGSLTLSASTANTYTGPTTIDAGSLLLDDTGGASIPSSLSINGPALVQLQAANQISPSASVQLNSVPGLAILDLNNFNQSLGSLSDVDGGSVKLGTGSLTLGAFNASSTFLGSISGSGSVVKTGTGTLTLGGSNTYTGPTTVSGGMVVFNSPAALAAGSLSVGASGQAKFAQGSSSQTFKLSSLSITPGGKLDLTSNALSLSYGSGSDPLSTIRSLLSSGYDSGKWNGSGIMSSSAALSPSLYTLSYVDSADHSGVNPTSNSILIRYGLVGDLNGDGSVNLSDLLLLTRSFGTTSSDSGVGDFNFDGSTNISDFLALVRNFGKTLAASVTTATAAAPKPVFARRV